MFCHKDEFFSLRITNVILALTFGLRKIIFKRPNVAECATICRILHDIESTSTQSLEDGKEKEEMSTNMYVQKAFSSSCLSSPKTLSYCGI